jgi:hypothetical protein
MSSDDVDDEVDSSFIFFGRPRTAFTVAVVGASSDFFVVFDVSALLPFVAFEVVFVVAATFVDANRTFAGGNDVRIGLAFIVMLMIREPQALL